MAPRASELTNIMRSLLINACNAGPVRLLSGVAAGGHHVQVCRSTPVYDYASIDQWLQKGEAPASTSWINIIAFK
jgi:hypothetical protein